MTPNPLVGLNLFFGGLWPCQEGHALQVLPKMAHYPKVAFRSCWHTTCYAFPDTKMGLQPTNWVQNIVLLCCGVPQPLKLVMYWQLPSWVHFRLQIPTLIGPWVYF